MMPQWCFATGSFQSGRAPMTRGFGRRGAEIIITHTALPKAAWPPELVRGVCRAREIFILD